MIQARRRFVTYGTLVSGLVLVAGIACHDHDAPTAPSTGSGLVRGSVTSEKTSEGVPNLVVALSRNGRVLLAAPTDSSGAFRFDGLARGDYTVSVTGLELAGLTLRTTALTPATQQITVADAPVDVFVASVGLIPPRIVGYVTCGATPIANAQLRVIGGATDEVVATNAQGKYGATDLDPGHYAIIVVSAPCAVSPSYAAADLQPGQAATVDFAG